MSYSFVELRDSKRNEDSIFNLMSFTQIVYSFGDILAERNDHVPGTSSLKGLSNKIIILAQVSHVSNDEGEEITSETVLSSCFQTVVFQSNFSDKFLLSFANGSFSFEKSGGGHHVVRVESTQFCHVEFLDCINSIFGEGLFIFESLPELELNIIYKTERCWPYTALSNFFHKFSSCFVVRE